jgi:hypothetical protein
MVGQQIYEEVLTAYDWPGAAEPDYRAVALMLGLVGLTIGATRAGPAGAGPPMRGRTPLGLIQQ